MTWTRTPAELPDDAFNVELSDAAYRTHHEAITHLFSIERTDCYIRTDEVRRFAGSPHADMAVSELVSIGWWCVKGQGYEVVHTGDVIRSGIVAQQNKRAHDKRNQAAARARRKGKVTTDVSADVTGDAVSQSYRQALEGGPQTTEGEGWSDVHVREVR